LPLEVDDLSGQFIDASSDRMIAVEQLVLDLIDIVLESGHDGCVAINYFIEDGLQDSFRAQLQQLRLGFQSVTNAGKVRSLRMSDRDHEVWAGEHMELAELDLLDVVEVARRGAGR
jgi:hypothetical protein